MQTARQDMSRPYSGAHRSCPPWDGDMNGRENPQVTAVSALTPGQIIRRARLMLGMTLAELGALTGYSAAQVSRYERNKSLLTDVGVLRRFARALDIPAQDFGLVPTAPPRRTSRQGSYPRLPAPRVEAGGDGGEDSVDRRTLLTGLTASAAAAVGAPILSSTGAAEDRPVGERLVEGLRDAMLGLALGASDLTPDQLPTELARASSDLATARYGRLAQRLPQLLRAAHQASGTGHYPVLAHGYLLATRVLIKLHEPQLGWMAADRARQIAHAAGIPLAIAEAVRQQAVLARQAGWHDQSLTLALAAADDSALRGLGAAGQAQRGLLIQCAAYTVAHQGDKKGMRTLTEEAASIAKGLGHSTYLKDTAGGFTPATVQLHLISAEHKAGDLGAAVAAARALNPAMLPTIERRALYFTDLATAHGQWGHRDECLAALLEAERWAPEETRSRPRVRALVGGLLVSGRSSLELRALAARCGALA
ncbi:helix-turn-helix transcriptional regulator [Streptomyces sp. NPDC052051]|uniref:helix-turn-helix domain-containing protein n=1 Tax=Streptomyces sp. NPDC052051 TaxID=3154649 RepID=UPI0034148837